MITENKIITQTYNGAHIMSGIIKGMQALVEEIYTQALLVHCHIYILNLVLQFEKY